MAYTESHSGRPDLFDKYVDRTVRNPLDIEHIWADDYQQHSDECSTIQEFNEWRSHVGGLLLLPADVNRSYQDQPFDEKAPHYAKQDLYSASLTEAAYQHQPQFTAFVGTTGLPFHSYQKFGKAEQLERRALVLALAKLVWNPDRLEEYRRMSDVGQPERKTQDRVVKLLHEQLDYDYLGNWKDRAGTSNIEVELLTQNLRARGYDDTLITKAIDQLKKAAAIGAGRDLYEANRDVYGLLRYGVKVKPGVGEQHETVWLIDWDDPQANHFAVAEEVTVLGQHTKRPDVVLYVNGIALVTLELKRSMVAVSEGIRQTIGNQQPEFIRPFFTTVQLVMAGNDVEGLRYAVIDTPEKYWLNWRLITDIDPATRAQVDAELAGIEGPLDQALVLLAPSTACWRSSTTSSCSTPGSRRPADRTSTSASRPRRSGCSGARAASSGTPRGRASRSPWCGWPSGCASTSRTPACCSSPTGPSWTSRSRASSTAWTRTSTARPAASTCSARSTSRPSG